MGDGFVSLYKRHVPFVMTQDVQPIEYDTIKIQPKGDLVSYIYLTRTELDTGKMIPWDWSSILDFSWYIGNKLIDKQDLNFVRYIHPSLMSRAHSKTNFDTVRSMFLPLAFSFCHELPFPIVALNYDTMYIKLTLGQTYDTNLYGYQCHVTYIHLDKPERDYFAYNKHVIPITQVQQIFNTSDVMLRNPVKFIATPPVKITNTSKLAVKVNQKYYKDPYYYTGAEMYYHTNYSTMEEPSTDHYPPEKLIGPTTFLSTAYGRGFYGVTTTSNSFTTVPWGASELGGSTYWESGKLTEIVTEFKSTASSNAQNAWKAFAGDQSIFWKSDPWYGSPNVYIVSASSNIANAWSPSWVSDGYLYGNNVGKSFTTDASSNVSNTNFAFDGKLETYWTSDSVYFSDYVGTYEMNTSSSSSTVSSNVRGAFINDGVAYWESGVNYGSYMSPITTAYTVTPSDAASVITYPTTSWKSDANFYASVNGFAVDVNASSNLTSGILIRAFDGSGIPWVSNNLTNTFGFSTRYGTYVSNASYDVSNSWRVFDSNSITQWVSNSVFYSQFTIGQTYNVSSTSNTTNTWLAFDYDPGTQWVSTNIFGNFTAPGVYTLTASSNASAEPWNMTNSIGWSSNNAYGNFIPANLQFVSNASSNYMSAWSAFSSSNIWIGTQVYGQIGIKGGTYVAANSSSTQDLVSNIFGSSGTWRSNAQYGRLLTPGTYVSTSNIFSNTGLFVSNVEFLTTVDEGFHTASASSNSSFAWMAFNDTYDFDFNVDVYKSYKLPSVAITTQSSPPATQLIDSYSATGSVTIDLGNHYSYQPVGNYSYATNVPGGTLSAIFDSSSSNFWFPSPTTSLYNDQTGDALSTPVPSFTLVLPTPVTIDDFRVTDQSSVDQTSDFLQGSNDGTTWDQAVPPTVTAYSQYKYSMPKVLRKYHTLSSMGITTSGTNISQFPNTNQGLFNFTTGQQFSYVKLGTYTVTGPNGNPYTLFNASPTPWTGVSSCTFVQVQLTVPNTSISASNFNPQPIQTQDSGSDRTFTFQFPTSTSDIQGPAPTVSSTASKYGYFIGGSLNVSTRTSGVTFPSTPFPSITTIPIKDGPDVTGITIDSTQTEKQITYTFNGSYFNIRYISIGCNESDAKAKKDLEQLNFSFQGITGVPLPTKDNVYMYRDPGTDPKSIDESLVVSSQQTTTGSGTQCAFFSTRVLYQSGITIKDVKFTSLATSTNQGTLYYIVSSTPLSSTQWTNKSAWTIGPSTIITNGSVITFTLPTPIQVNFNQYIHFAIISDATCIPRYAPSPAQSYTPDTQFFTNDKLRIFYGVGGTYDAGTAWATFANQNIRGFNIDINYSYMTQPIAATNRYWRYTYDLGAVQKINSITLRVSKRYSDSATYNIFFTIGTDIGGGVSRYIFNNSNMQNADGTTTNLQLFNPSGPNPYLGTETRGGEYYTFTLYNPSSVISDRRVPLSTWNVGGAPSGSSYLVLSNTDQQNPQNYTGDTIRVVFTTITGLNSLPSSGITLQSLNGIYGYYNNGNYKPYPFVTVPSITYTGTPRLLPDTFIGSTTVVNTAIGSSGGPCIDSNNPPTLIWQTSSGESFKVKSFAIVHSGVAFPTIIEYKLKINGSWTPAYLSSTFINPFPNTTVTIAGGTQTISGLEIRIKGINGLSNQLVVDELRLFDGNDTIITNTSGLFLYRNPTIYKFELIKNNKSFLPVIPTSPYNFTSPNFTTYGGLYYAYSGQNPSGDYIDITFKDPTDVRLFTAFRMTGTFDSNFVRINYSTDGGINFVPNPPSQCTFSSPDLFTIPASASPPTGTVPSKWRIYFTQAPSNSARITIGSLVLLNGSNDIRTGVAQKGGTYTGPQTTTGGEWVEYVFPKPIRASSVKIFPSRAGEPYPDTWAIQAKTTPTTYTDVLRLTNRPINRIVEETITNIQTSNTYRFIVTSTNSPASSNTCKIGNIIFNYATANLIATETPVLTSGMNVFAYSNSVTVSTIKTAQNYWGVRKYTFDNGTRWTTSNNLQAFMFDGNVVAPYNITSGQAVLSVYNGTTINAWLDVDSQSYDTTNNLACHYGQTGNFTINKAYTKGQQFNVRFITYDPPSPPVITISSNAAGSQTLINTSNVTGRWFPGGSYNGFEVSSNLWAQIQLPSSVQASDYIFNANTASSWQILGANSPTGPFTRIHTGTRTSYGVDLYTVSTPGSYSVYRLSIDKCDPGVLYPSARTLVFRDSIGRAIVGNTFGTFTTSIPIANYPVGNYTSTIVSYPHTLTTAQNTVTITVPSPITIQSMQIDGTFTSYKVSGLSSSTTFNPGYSTINSLPAAASYTFTFTFTGTTATITRFELMNRTVGLILPTIDKRNSLVLNDAESRGGPYTGSEITNGIRGEWIELNSTTTFSMYGYQMSSNAMPSSWHVIGWNGTTWSNIDSNINMFQNITTYSNINIPTNRVGPWSKVRFIFSNSIQSNVSLTSLNVYSSNFTTLIKPGAVTNDLATTTYIDTTYSNSGSNFDTRTQTWYARGDDLTKKLQLSFKYPVSINAFSYTSTFTPFGLLYDIFDTTPPTFNSLSNIYTNSINIVNTGYSSDLTLGTTAPYYQYGYMYTYRGGKFRFETSGSSSEFYLWVNKTNIVPSQADLKHNSVQPWIELTLAPNKFVPISIYSSGGGTRQLTANTSIDRPGPQASAFPNWLFPTANSFANFYSSPSGITIKATPVGNPVPFSTTLLNVVNINRGPINVFTISNTSRFTDVQIEITRCEGYRRPIMQNITFYDENGPLNIPGAFGGTYKGQGTGEWVQIKFPTSTVANSYSFGTGPSSVPIDWTLMNSTSTAGVWNIIDTRKSTLYSANTTYAIQQPSSNAIYRLVINKLGPSKDSSAQITNFKLFGSNGLELIPYTINSNIYTTPSNVFIGTSIVGNYTVTSSTGVINKTGAFSNNNTDVPTTTFANYSLDGEYRSTQSTILNRSNVQPGEWVQLEFPSNVLVDSFSFSSNPQPKYFTFTSSNDAIHWMISNVSSSSSTQKFYTNLTKTIPCKYFRFTVSNIAAPVTTMNIDSIIFWQNGKRINSFVNTPRTFGGPGGTEFINLTLPNPRILSSFIVNSPTKQFASNVYVYGTGGTLIAQINTYTQSDTTVYYKLPFTNSAHSTYKIVFNELQYNSIGSNVFINQVQFLDEKSIPILPTLVSTSAQYQIQSIQNTPAGVYTVSNVLPFDDNTQTRWIVRNFDKVTGSNVSSVPAPSFDISFPSNVTVVGYALYNSYMNSWTVSNATSIIDTRTNQNLIDNNAAYYSISNPYTSNYYKFSVTKTIVGYDACALGGITFFDSIGRITPKIVSTQQLISSSSSDIRGGKIALSSAPENINIRLPAPTIANTYTIYADPFPATWNVYSGTTLIHAVSNYHATTKISSFILPDSSGPVSNITFSFLETQATGTSFNESIKYIQMYDFEGVMVLPKFTSNIAYDETYKMSTEMYGLYEYMSSSNNASIINAFDGSEDTYFENLTGNSYVPLYMESNGFTMYYANNAVFNCFDFRNYNSATRGTNPSGECVWIGKVFPTTRVRSLIPNISVSQDSQNIVTITKPINTFVNAASQILDPPVYIPYTTNGVVGEWIQIKLPSFVKPVAYRVVADTNVQSWVLFGSVNNINWTSIHTVSEANDYTQLITCPSPFMYFRLVITSPITERFKIYNFELYNNQGRINSYLTSSR